ncbi:MAG: trypsin-like serine protease [Desulfobacterales bacterium]|nr:trypsin-like serine protease [Desulfobacterales bacterium]
MFFRPVMATDFSELYRQVNGSVVTITINQQAHKLAGGQVLEQTIEGYGAGVIVDANGLVLTAAHVVNLAKEVMVHLNNGVAYPARILSAFPFADIALVKIIDPPADLQVAMLGDSDQLKIGEEVIVIGTPSGLSQTLTVGHFSGRPVDTGSFNLADTEFLQTDAAITQGNSGGPMFNARGEIMGVVSHFRADAGGLGFVASVNMASKLIKNAGDIWLGLSVEPLDRVLSDVLNSPYPAGVMVQQIAPGSLGAQLGLRAGLVPATINGRAIKLGGDIIVAVGGQPLSVSDEGIARVYKYLAGRARGEKVEMTAYRNGKEISLSAPKP